MNISDPICLASGEPDPVPPCQDKSHQWNQGSRFMGEMRLVVVAVLRVGISVSVCRAWEVPSLALMPCLVC